MRIRVRATQLIVITLIGSLSLSLSVAEERRAVPQVQIRSEPNLQLSLEGKAEGSLPQRIRVRGEDQRLDLSRLQDGQRIGRVRLTGDGGVRFDFQMRLLSRRSRDQFRFRIHPEHPEFSAYAVVEGEMKNLLRGFELEMAASEWLAELSRHFRLPQSVQVAFEFDIPVVAEAAQASYLVTFFYPDMGLGETPSQTVRYFAN